MISAQDLRIGNWVRHSEAPSSHAYPNQVFQVSSALFSDLETAHCSEYNLEPIELTPELLFKCGFEKDDRLSHWHYYRIRIYNDGEKHRTLTIEYAPDSNKFYFRALKGRRMDTVITYLHQLQNLFYSLTGKEIEVNL